METFFDLFFSLVGTIFENFFDIIINALSLLPMSPFAQFLEAVTGFEYLGYMNYFIPFHAMAVVTNLWILAISAFYVFKFIRKYTNYISQFKELFS